jgi:gamma-glutamyl:cysteine ligase YbdK (ATP-grasp superfamily)
VTLPHHRNQLSANPPLPAGAHPPLPTGAASLPPSVGCMEASLPEGDHRQTYLNEELTIRGPLTPAVEHRAMTAQERQELLDRAWTFVDQVLSFGQSERSARPRMMGIEIEGALLRKDGSYASGTAAPLLSRLNRKLWHDEAGSASVEFASPPIQVTPGALPRLLRHTQSQFEALSELAKTQGLLVIGTGIVPVLAPNQVLRPEMSSASDGEEAIALHWQAIEKERAKAQHDGHSAPRRRSVKLEYDGAAYEMTTDTAAWTTINSLHVTFQTRHHEDALHLFNGLRALTPLMLGASCNTGLLNGHKLKYQDYRPKIIAGSGPLDYNFDTCTGLIVDKAESLRHAFELLMPNVITDPCPMISLKSGENPTLRDAFESVRESIFPSIQMRFHPKDPLTILIEYRPLSVQLTVDRNIAMSALLLLTADYMAAHPHEVRHISSEEFLKDIESATKDGMNAEIHNPLRGCGPARGTVAEILTAALPVLERAGLASGIVGPHDLTVLNAFRQQLAEGETSATILRREVAQHGMSQALARNQLIASADNNPHIRIA